MFGEVQHTPQDLRFQLFGFPCRVHPLFWLSALLFALPGRGLPGNMVLALLISRTACLFVSILVHELGHAFLIRWAGFRPEVVLHAFGGYALYHPHRAIRTSVSVAISFAGPAAGFLLYGLVLLIEYGVTNGYQHRLSPVLRDMFLQLEWINLYWGLVNLLPIYPLDGGQIVRAWMQSRWGLNGIRQSLMVSIIAAGATAFVFYKLGGDQLTSMPVILFGILCLQSVQAYNETPRVRW